MLIRQSFTEPACRQAGIKTNTMGLFDRFKKQQPASPAQPSLTRAQEQYDQGEYENALSTLIQGFREDVNHQPLYRLAGDCLEKLGGSEEKSLFDHALAHFSDPDTFYDLGAHFLKAGHYPLAAPFFEKALALKPGDINTAHDLALSYARRFRIADAVKTLNGVNAGKDFWVFYFLTKCRLLNGDTQHIRQSIDSLENAVNNIAGKPGADTARLKVEELKEILSRYETIPNPAQHIRDWQFIQYGSIILDYFDNEDDYVAGGRYVASWGTRETIRAITERLKLLLRHLGVTISTVQSLQDRDSEILGRLIALELDTGFSFYEPGYAAVQSLLVAGDTAGFNDYEELNSIREGQLLFALNQNWLQSAYINPDICGFMTQYYSFPWNGGGLRMKEDGETEQTAPDERPAEEIARDLYGLTAEQTDTEDLFSFYQQRAHLLKGIGTKTAPYRYNFMIESPVPGSYFGS